MDDIIIISLPDDPENHIYYSPSFERSLGMSKDIIAKEEWLKSIHKDDAVIVNENYKKFRRDNKEYNITYRILVPDNTIKWINEKGCLLRGTVQKEMTAYLRVLNDITIHKQSEGKFKNMAKVVSDVIGSFIEP